MENEVWMPIQEFPQYEVSNYGFVRIKESKKPIRRDRSGAYFSVRLKSNGGVSMKMCHRLVASAFIPNPLNKPFVNHLDCNKTNSHVDNLEWCTQEENMQHAAAMGAMPIGPRHYSAKAKTAAGIDWITGKKILK